MRAFMVSVDRVRNIGIVAHIDAGKTTVSERFLFHGGRIHKTGEVHDGATQLDWMAQERERGITITAAATTLPWRDCEIHLLDTPGHVDFTVEVERCLRVLDGCVVVFCGVGGVQAQSETVWRQADKFHVGRLVLVNKLDRVGASFERVVAEIHERLRSNAVPIQLPIGAGETFAGAVDLVRMVALSFSGVQGEPVQEQPVPAELADAAARARERLVLALADLDDGIAERYLAGEEIAPATLAAALRKATIAGRFVPVLCGSALRNKGMEPLLDAVVDYLPSPLDVPPATGHDLRDPAKILAREARADGPLAALAFKVSFRDGRKVVFLRLFSGTLHGGNQVLNARTQKKERVTRLFRVHADKRVAVDAAAAGEIVAAAGLDHAVTGDTLCAPDAPILLERIDACVPVLTQSIEVEHQDERVRLQQVLAKMAEEDPTFRVREDAETGQTILVGMGELHLEVIVDRIRAEYGVRATLGRPQVVCRTTVLGEGHGQAVFARELQQKAIFGEAACTVRARARGAGLLVRSGLPPVPPLPHGVVDAALEGLRDGTAAGLDGQVLDDLEVVLTSLGVREEADPLIGARAAAAEALRRAVDAAGPAQLQPIMRVEVAVEAPHLGAILGDLQQRQGQVLDVVERERERAVLAHVPLRKLFGYATRLRSLTEGHGTFTMEFHRYDIAGG
ncbi:MAG: elongation factor G [Planctomycetes bacterium]|nr:elongation factor G [Planctomycetota bacterium]